MFLVIRSNYFVAGIEVGGKVAPIISYMKDWTEDQILEYCVKKRWSAFSIDHKGEYVKINDGR